MRLLVVCAAIVIGACNEASLDPDRLPTAGGAPDDGPQAGDDEELREVSCIDQSITELMLFDLPSPDAIVGESEESGVFETQIDTTAGGLTPRYSYVYARFTEDGLEQLDLDDEAAFESDDWHIALRRFVIRLNSGVSGPGEVTAARTAPETEFEAVEEEPEELDYRTEQYFTESCVFIADSGIGAPASALVSFWSYRSCVEMTGNVYVVAVGDQRVKFEVLGYYPEANQRICNDTGMVPMPSGAGSMRIRWAFLD